MEKDLEMLAATIEFQTDLMQHMIATGDVFDDMLLFSIGKHFGFANCCIHIYNDRYEIMDVLSHRTVALLRQNYLLYFASQDVVSKYISRHAKELFSSDDGIIFSSRFFKENQYPEEEAGVLEEPGIRYGNLDLYTRKIELRPGKKEPKTQRVHFDYIMGNPPFVGARWLNSAQREDIKTIFGPKWKNSGILDYVCCWYKKAYDYMNGTMCRAALVSTNSITQGEHVAAIWKPLFEMGLHFDFAHRTFIWDSEASEKAHVHCVIIGFSTCHSERQRRIYDGGNENVAKNINGYLLDAPDVFIESRVKPLCDVPEIRKGNQPTDGGNLIIEKEDYEEFVKREPASLPFIKRFFGAKEYLNNIPRYCLWLVNVAPSQIKAMPSVMERVSKVREMRLASSDPGTHRLAETPTVFRETNNPEHAIVIPEVSSERRRYVPMSFIGKDVICSNKLQIIPDANLYEFGILESSVHMAWMRVVCGRLKSDYDYSKKIVYNNFPWPDSSLSDVSKLKIEQTAQSILEARELYPTESLADLYDETLMPSVMPSIVRVSILLPPYVRVSLPETASCGTVREKPLSVIVSDVTSVPFAKVTLDTLLRFRPMKFSTAPRATGDGPKLSSITSSSSSSSQLTKTVLAQNNAKNKSKSVVWFLLFMIVMF